MDEGLLNDLLECSVCLERLDTSSRVLPCQHTFCLKCLKVIVESHKELRCPECRVLVEAKVEELPPNVLLMRILEGMKNSAPRKMPTHRRSGHPQAHNQQVQQTSRTDGKQLPPHARAMFDFNSKEPGDLSFKKGETIFLQKKLDQFWYQGDCSGRTGNFPITYVQIVVPLPTPNALCKALYDFRMSAPDEEGCLAFDKGAIITVHRRVDENWAEGRLDQRVGIFPIAFVELNIAARQLMNSAPLNRPVPSVPDHARPSHSEHRHSQHPHRYRQMTMSTPTTVHSTYQNSATMSQSHPNYQQAQMLPPHSQILVTQPANQTITTISHGGLLSTAGLQRNIMEPTQTKHAIDLVHLNIHNKQSTMGIQSVSRITDNCDRLRTHKYENYSSTPVHKIESTYQSVRTHDHFPVSVANFNAGHVSSDSSSSMNTPSVGVSSTTTPNSSSNTSTCESAEPSLPSSPDNNAERNAALPPANTAQNSENEVGNEPESSLNVSMGVLSLNESSTATNTSLNVSLPPSESPKLNVSVGSTASQTQPESQDASSNTEPCMHAPSSSKEWCNGSEPLMNFGLVLQAALSPTHKDASVSTRQREHHHKDKRHSLTPSTHMHGNHSTPNRHSAEILATSLLDHTPERTDLQRSEQGGGRDSGRRGRGSRSSDRALPALYVALHPYSPQRPDELELKRGAFYTVVERCRDGWYKGSSERSSRFGVFPGNYVTPAHGRHVAEKSQIVAQVQPQSTSQSTSQPTWRAPDAPPRAHTPQANTGVNNQAFTKQEKQKEKAKAEKSMSSGVSLMKRLAAMKKCKSPPPAGYSMDNPVFEDVPGTSLMLKTAHHSVHVRSGSCPSQLLRALPGSERIRHKERPSVLPAHHSHRSNEDPWQSQHRKSQSLDVTATRRDKHHSQTVKERFRCIVPYPPNSEYELELKVDDIVIVSKKRGDGWYKGTLQRTGRTGLFPASFVQSCPE